MRKAYEIIMVIAAAGLAAAVALIDISTDSADLGTLIGGEELFAAPPPISAPTFPPLPPSLVPPGSSTPVPTDPPATPASLLPFGVQPPQGVTKASSPAVRVPGTTSVPRAATATTDPPAAKPKPPPTKTKPLTKTKPKPSPTKPNPKSKSPPAKPKPKSEMKPEDSLKTSSAGSSPRPIGSAADSRTTAAGR